MNTRSHTLKPVVATFFMFTFCLLPFFWGCRGLRTESNATKITAGKYVNISIHRGVLCAAREAKMTSPLMTDIIMLVQDGTVVNPSEVVCKLSTTQSEDSLLREKASLTSANIALMKARGLIDFTRAIAKTKVEKARIELKKCREEWERASESRNWLKLYEQEVGQKVRTQEISMSKRRLDIQKKLEARGFSAKSELLSSEKNSELLELEASYSQALIPWLREFGKQRDIFNAAQALQQASRSYYLACLEAKSDEFSAQASIESKTSDFSTIASSIVKIESEIASGVLRAPVGGVAVRKKTFSGTGWEKVSEGDRVFPSISFLSILDLSKYCVEFYVDQHDCSRLELNSPIRFRPDAAQELLLDGKVSEVSIMAEESEVQNPDGERMIKAKAVLDSIPENLLVGYCGTVELLLPIKDGVQTSQDQMAILVNRGAMKFENNRWVFTSRPPDTIENLSFIGTTDRWVCFSSLSAQFQPEKKTRTFTIMPSKIRREFSLPGEIKARKRSLIASTFSGRVAMILEDGASVKSGDVVAKLEVSDIEKSISDLSIQEKNKIEQLLLSKKKSEVELAKALQNVEIKNGALEISKLEHVILLRRRNEDEIIKLKKDSELIESRISLLQEQIQLEKDLVKRGLRSELELLEMQLKLSQQEREKLVTNYKLDLEISGPTKREMRLSELAMLKAQEETKLALIEYSLASFSSDLETQALEADISSIRIEKETKERKLADSTIHCNQDGVAILPETFKMGQMTKTKVGDQVQGQIPFMNVADMNSLEIRLEVPEMDVKFFAPQKPVDITLKSAPGKVFKGNVRQVGLIADSDDRTRQDGFVEVFIAINKPVSSNSSEAGIDPAFRPGATCEVKFRLYDLSDALVLPLDTVIPGASGPFVLSESGEKILCKSVFSDGLNGIVISDGVSAGQKVVSSQ